MSDVLVREASVADAREIAAIRIEGWRAAYPGLIAASVLESMDEAADTVRFASAVTEPDTRFVVAERDATVEGFCAFGPDRDEPAPGRAEIYAIYVRPSSWGSGVGRALLDSCIAELGVHEVRLWVLAGNTAARGFYDGRGFRFAGTERDLPGLLDPAGVTVREVQHVWEG